MLDNPRKTASSLGSRWNAWELVRTRRVSAVGFPELCWPEVPSKASGPSENPTDTLSDASRR